MYTLWFFSHSFNVWCLKPDLSKCLNLSCTREGHKVIATIYFSLHMGALIQRWQCLHQVCAFLLSYHVTWTVFHAWLHNGISIKTMHSGHCLWNREVRYSTWIGGTITYFGISPEKKLGIQGFRNTYKSIHFLLYGSLFDS